VLAAHHDGTKVPDGYSHLDELVCGSKPIPGRFIYGRPTRGRLGRNFVVRAILGRIASSRSTTSTGRWLNASPEPGTSQRAQPNLYGGTYPATRPPPNFWFRGVVSMVSRLVGPGATKPISVGALRTTRLITRTSSTFGRLRRHPVNARAAQRALAPNFSSTEIQTSVARPPAGFRTRSLGAST